jgi:hypothetical protein
MSDPSTTGNPAPEGPPSTSLVAPTPGLAHRFQYHPPPTIEVAQLHARLRELHLALADQIDALVPASREKALALTNLEQSLMWSNAAIARAPWEEQQ